jgi:hypothetical protein
MSTGDYEMLPKETFIKQFARAAYALLVIRSFVQFLSLVQIHKDFGFLVRSMQLVFIELIPFFILFSSLISIFAFAVYALNIPLAEDENSNDFKGMNLALSYFLHVLRTAFGDF